jgi:hypothetical protein
VVSRSCLAAAMEAASVGTFSLAVTTWKCSGGTTTFTDFLPLFCTPLKSTGMMQIHEVLFGLQSGGCSLSGYAHGTALNPIDPFIDARRCQRRGQAACRAHQETPARETHSIALPQP